MTNNTINMSPNASPGSLTGRTGVRRVNNVPLIILFLVIATFLIIMVLVAADRAADQNKPADEALTTAGSTSAYAKEITGLHGDGIIPAEKPPSIPALPQKTLVEEVSLNPSPEIVVPIAKPIDMDVPPAPIQNNQLNQPIQDEEANRIRLAKQQIFEEAIKSKLSVDSGAPRSPASTSTSPRFPQTRQEMIDRLAHVQRQIADNQGIDPTVAYQSRLAQIKNMTGFDTGVGDGSASIPVQSFQADTINSPPNAYEQFSSAVAGDRWRLDSKVEPPHSPYELRAGFVVSATLISGINSELPGQIVAQTSQNVYDTATGNFLLIPQGSRLVGSYSSDVAYGQGRVLVAWQRIVFPDGKAIDIGAMPGADGAGYSGFHDQVNNYYFRTFASAILMSGITAGITLSQDDSDSDSGSGSQRASDAMSEALGQQLGQVAGQMIAKNMNIAPTLEIRPGYRFNVIVAKDMIFSKPYRSFDY